MLSKPTERRSSTWFAARPPATAARRRSSRNSRPTCPAHTADILLGFKARIENFAEVQVAWGLRGWSQCPAPDCLLPCSWGGVLCNERNRVQQL